MKTLIFIALLFPLISSGQNNAPKAENCDCSVLGLAYNESSDPMSFGISFIDYEDVLIAIGYRIVFKSLYTKEKWHGKCFRNFGDSLHMELKFDEGVLIKGEVKNNIGFVIWEMNVQAPKIGYIKKWNRKGEIFSIIDFDSTGLTFHDYNEDSTMVWKYNFYRKDHYYGKSPKVNDCQIFENGVLTSSFTVGQDRYTYEVEEYFPNGSIKAKGHIHTPIYSLTHGILRQYSENKTGPWEYFDANGRKSTKEHKPVPLIFEDGN